MRKATKAERTRYSGRVVALDRLPIFCAPSWYTPKVANSMLSGIEFRYQVRGKLCWMREIHSVKEGDVDNLALFEFDNGDMLWHSVEEMYREPGDGKVPGGYRLVRKDGRRWL